MKKKSSKQKSAITTPIDVQELRVTQFLPVGRWRWPALLLIVALAGFGWVRLQPTAPAPALIKPPPAKIAANETAVAGFPARYVGALVCKSCHAQQYQLWQNSDHAKAMQNATAANVEGNFNGTSLTDHGVTSRFFKREGKFFVNTDGASGKLADFEVKYTFGVRPLQQYLVEFEDGRLQPLPIAWDSRTPAAGGQRWFHLYAGLGIDHRDPLFWTGYRQNWNYMCAECHTTHLDRGFDASTNRFHTTWSEMNVACEACHGPGSAHVTKAQGPNYDPKDNGLRVQFPARAAWLPDAKTGAATRALARVDNTELDTCGICHSRRGQFWPGDAVGHPLLDTHLPALLGEGLYHADGQMRDEVFNYGSFVQSKMYAKGVSCGDCHEPHSGALRVAGNGLCLQCHAPRYDSPAHHHHSVGSDGALCANCHMPLHTYMGVDRRHDHSFRVPRPDLSLLFGTPNACTDCHQDHPLSWASRQVTQWFGPAREGFQQFEAALSAAHAQSLAAPTLLKVVVQDPGQPALARATAFAEFAPFLSAGLAGDFKLGLKDADPLVRIGALQGLASLPIEQRWAQAGFLLDDPLRAVRLEATEFLAAVPAQQLDESQQRRLARAEDEYIQAQLTNADRPEAHLNLGVLYAERGDAVASEREYLRALQLDPTLPQAAINLADLYRDLGRDEEGEALLRQQLQSAPKVAELHHALGLLLVRRQRLPQAIAELRAAATLAPTQARYSYVYAVALDASGDNAKALHLLEQTRKRHPTDRDTLTALVGFYRQNGQHAQALAVAQQLSTLLPGDAQAQQLLAALQRQR